MVQRSEINELLRATREVDRLVVKLQAENEALKNEVGFLREQVRKIASEEGISIPASINITKGHPNDIKLRELTDAGKRVFEKVVAYYGINEINNALTYIRINKFILWLEDSNRLDFFESQFDAYTWYKEKSSSTIHSVESFFSFNTPMQGAWCSENWVKKAEMLAEAKGIAGKYYKLKK